MIILIPAYEPSQRLIHLIHDLKDRSDDEIVVVDDGSGPAYQSIFDRAASLGCTVLTHEHNKGKGAALKTGFRYILETKEASGVVTADCDGQHLPKDIIRIAEEVVQGHPKTIVLGSRKFAGKVPFRSRFGNSVTRSIFSFVSGAKIYDTQTGLRGFGAEMLPWLCRITGDRFEYEMNMLLEAVPAGCTFKEIDIDTVYLERNQSSHFHFLKDSFRVYLPIVKFSVSSLMSAFLDVLLLVLIQLFTSNLLLAVVGARVCSAVFNYAANRRFVFSTSNDVPVKSSLPRYMLLALVVMLANYGVIDFYYSTIGLSLILAKIFTETTIFLFSYWVQRKFVFVKSGRLQ
ncbi:glycosyltransferase [Paenibacillus nanensis]|uniref:Glycosyltransferase n=1 Tax=Paenibacillus nanensis TaxID=393251 RepID=A0A3A1ULK4_9BACL|nr:bifunctional glycosyltransferase family 2/GtrA family protein [Paenibacillus nanensis]RIX48663.1 glycosyltransferase [Paenibacillus nanensis]